MLEVIEENKINQNVSLIINYHIPNDNILVKITEEPTTLLESMLLNKGSISRNSGISNERGLLTPEQTPEPITKYTTNESFNNDQSITTTDKSIVYLRA